MTVIAVTRHEGARQWLARRGIRVDRRVDHLDIDDIRPGDTIIGTLPVHLAAEVCRRGGRYVHLAMNVPPQHRGRELSAEDMERFQARLQAFHLEALEGDFPPQACD